MPSNLKPIDFKEDVENYDAFHETKQIEFSQCNHRDSWIENGEVKCKCGAHWSAPSNVLNRLLKALKDQ